MLELSPWEFAVESSWHYCWVDTE